MLYINIKIFQEEIYDHDTFTPLSGSTSRSSRNKESESYQEYRIYMNTFTSEETSNPQIQDSTWEQFEVTDKDLEKLKEVIPHSDKKDIYKPLTFKSRFLNQHTYIYLNVCKEM